MIKKASIVCFIVLLGTLILTGVNTFYNNTVANSAPINLLANPGLESGALSPWNQWHYASVVSGNSHSGSYSLQIGAGPSDSEQNVTGLLPNTSYTLSAWGYTKASGEPLQIGVKNFGGSETWKTISSTSYTPVSLNFTTSSTGTTATIYCYKATGTNNAYCDDLQLTPTPVNLVANPGLESGALSPWGQWHYASVVSGNAHSGNYALQIGAGPSDSEQNLSNLAPNTTYTLSGWGFTKSSSEPLQIGVKNFGGTETSKSISSTSYSQVSLSFTTGSSNTTATIYCYKPNGTNYGYCDDFQLAPGGSASAAPAPTPTTAAPSPTATPTQAPATTSSSIYWGTYINGVPWDMNKLAAFESNAGKGVSIVHFGQPWVQGGVYNAFPTTLVETIRQHGSIPMINWGSWDTCCGTTQSAWRLSSLYNGTYDTYIKQWAAAAKAWGHPFFLRFDHEMNGWWQFPWSEQVNGNQPGDYVKAWRHVHDIFTQAGATNVTWVWAPNVVGPNTTPLSELYPGDSYVDWTALDGYNWGTDHGNVWQTFSQVFSQSYTALTQLAPSKPIMIAETASSENGGSKANWITDVLQTQLPKYYPKIKAYVWFNWNDNDTTLSWPVESSSTSIAAFKAGITTPYYAANSFASIGTGPVQPLK